MCIITYKHDTDKMRFHTHTDDCLPAHTHNENKGIEGREFSRGG